MNNYYLGQILLFSFNYAPVGWMLCNGGILDIENNASLYSLIKNKFGGNPKTTFALPNLLNLSPVPDMQYYIAVTGVYPPKS
jgi:microcystin-dependent protein